ncbi:hypothetical protein [Thiolapillus sp.]|uniref:hypothetical protein n=1 Tax=Thiolapillus sp. TaxID=2017437 RepID=UPI003AF6C159
MHDRHQQLILHQTDATQYRVGFCTTGAGDWALIQTVVSMIPPKTGCQSGDPAGGASFQDGMALSRALPEGKDAASSGSTRETAYCRSLSATTLRTSTLVQP